MYGTMNQLQSSWNAFMKGTYVLTMYLMSVWKIALNSDKSLCSYIDSVMYSDCIPLTMPGSVESYAYISYMYALWNYITYKALNSLGCGIYFESCTVLIFNITLWWIKNTYYWLLEMKLYIYSFFVNSPRKSSFIHVDQDLIKKPINMICINVETPGNVTMNHPGTQLTDKCAAGNKNHLQAVQNQNLWWPHITWHPDHKHNLI